MTRRESQRASRPKLRVDSSEFFPIVIEALESGSRVAFTPRGRSMAPTLRDGSDVVYLERATTFSKYDVALYRRASGQYVLHRIVGSSSDGTFVFCGDGQTTLEHGILRAQILGKVVAFERGNLRVDCSRSRVYALYSRFRVGTRLFRAFFRRFRRIAAGVFKRVLRGESRRIDAARTR